MPVDSAVDSLDSVSTQLRKRLYRLERRDSIDPATARRDVDRRIMVIQRLPGGVFLATRDGWVQESLEDDSLRLLDSRTHRSRVLHPLMNFRWETGQFIVGSTWLRRKLFLTDDAYRFTVETERLYQRAINRGYIPRDQASALLEASNSQLRFFISSRMGLKRTATTEQLTIMMS